MQESLVHFPTFGSKHDGFTNNSKATQFPTPTNSFPSTPSSTKTYPSMASSIHFPHSSSLSSLYRSHSNIQSASTLANSTPNLHQILTLLQHPSSHHTKITNQHSQIPPSIINQHSRLRFQSLRDPEMVRDASDVQLQEVDVVVVALKPDLGFLAAWRELLKGCHLIVVQGEDFTGAVRIPEGFDVDVYMRTDMVRLLGPELSRALQFTGYGSRGFGYLVSRRRYVFTMEADCVPAQDPEGYVVNPVVEHVLNLKTPATPFFFNTLYDPFREGADFVRGYPFSLREGVPTAISQGSWISEGSSKRYVDAVLTVPKHVLYTASGANLAFDRHLVGPLMFEPAHLGSAGELWSGLCAKTICDCYPWGVKTGLPYVCRSEKVPLEQGEGRSEKLDVIAQFFQGARLSGNPLDVEGCYLEIAEQAKSKLSAVDPVFKEVASSMQAWIQAWNKLGH